MGLTPLLEPTAAQRTARDMRIALKPGGPLFYHHKGVRYYYAPQSTARDSPRNIVNGLNEVVSFFKMREPNRVWLLRGGWDHPLSEVFVKVSPEFGDRYDHDIDQQTNKALFVMRSKDLRLVAKVFDENVEKARREQVTHD